MAAWVTTTLVLCLFGFLIELRPSEPFLTEYLIDPRWVNITLEEAYYDVYPVWTYSYLAVVVIVFLLTDFLRYKLVIIAEGFAYIATWCLLIWGSGVPQMQLMQFTYGIATSTEVAYYTYIYAKVDRKHYQKVTSFTRSSLLLGRFLSGFLGQLLSSMGCLNFHELNYFTLASVSLATILSFFLPPITNSIYFHKAQEPEELTEPLQSSDPHGNQNIEHQDSQWRLALKKVVEDFRKSFGNVYVLKWSLWWALGMCGNLQVGNYIQPLWEKIHPVNYDSIEIYNGAVEAGTTLTGAILTFLLGYAHFNWSLIGEPILAVISIFDGIILVVMATTENIVHAYIGYWAFRCLYQMLITVASFEVARHICDDSYGLVFGFNTFMALLFQTCLTLTMADDAGLALPPRTQFIVYGGFWMVIGVIFVSMFLFELFTRGFVSYVARVREEGIWMAQSRLESHAGNGSGELRREAPLGSTEPQ